RNVCNLRNHVSRQKPFAVVFKDNRVCLCNGVSDRRKHTLDLVCRWPGKLFAIDANDLLMTRNDARFHNCAKRLVFNRIGDIDFFLTAFVRGAGSVKVRSIKSLNRTRNQQSKVPMIPFTRYLKLGVGVLCGLALCAGAAQAPQQINIKQLSTKVEDVVVPLPNEIFGALNKLGGVNWKQHVRSDKGPNFTERPRIALLLGTVIADGFIAVQAEDAEAVKDIGQRVMTLAKGIGVGNSITPHAKAIIEAADK